MRSAILLTLGLSALVAVAPARAAEPRPCQPTVAEAPCAPQPLPCDGLGQTSTAQSPCNG